MDQSNSPSADARVSPPMPAPAIRTFIHVNKVNRKIQPREAYLPIQQSIGGDFTAAGLFRLEININENL
jgi:hypothetical protein